MNSKIKAVLALLILVAAAAATFKEANATEVGEVDTTFRALGKNDRIVVEVFDDPKVKGVSCYVSRARTGGVGAYVGMAEDTSDASIACRQVADALKFSEKLPRQESVFTARSSILFKTLQVVRMVDPARNTLIYLTYSSKLVDGSPKNSVTAVPVPRANMIPVK